MCERDFVRIVDSSSRLFYVLFLGVIVRFLFLISWFVIIKISIDFSVVGINVNIYDIVVRIFGIELFVERFEVISE